MNRRTLLKLMTAMSLAGCRHSIVTKKDLKVVVAGAGIIGASIAYHLAKAGATVTVIDQEGPATHASLATFAWLNASWAKQPRHYHTLNQDSVSSWERWQQDLDLPVRWGGSLEWFAEPDRQLRLIAQIAEQAAWGEAARMVEGDELAALEPHVNFGGVNQVALSGNDGTVDPVIVTRLLLSAAEALGVTVRYPCALVSTALQAGRLVAVDTSLGMIAADRLVLATGAAPDTAREFAGIDIPQRSTPGVIAVTEPLPRLLNRILVAPGAHMHQRDDGRIVLGEQGGPPQNVAHDQRLGNRPRRFPDPAFAAQHAARMLAAAEAFVPGVAAATIQDIDIGWRPMPLDGHPVLGASPRRPDVYVTIMHSGITLAPIVGQLVAHELMGGMRLPRLQEFRPERKFERVKRY